MKIYTKVVWEWDEEKGLIEKETECFDYEGPLVLCDSDDDSGEGSGVGDDSTGINPDTGQMGSDTAAQRAYDAQVYAQQHGTLERSGFENDQFLLDSTRSSRVNDPDGGSGGGDGTGPSVNPGSSQSAPMTSDAFKNLLFERYQKDVLNTPYESYSGERFAGFNPDQEQAFTDARNFAGAMPSGYQTAIDTAEDETGYTSGFKTAGQDTAGFQRELDARMNPFTQGVINQLQRDISEQQQMALGKTGEQARAAGAFGGSRQGVAEALTSGRYGDAFARTAGQLRSEQFNRAMSGVDQDRTAQEQFRGQAARTRLGAGQQVLSGTQSQDAATAQRINSLARIGQQQQAMDQASKDFDYQQFLEERDYDKMNILAGGGLLGSAPGDYREAPVYGREGGLGGFFDILFGSPTRLA